MVQLARMLGLGEGTEADFPRAKSLLDEAVESGKAVDPVAIWIAYGDIYRFGPGRYANLNTALGYYEKAAAAGSAAANLAAAELESTARSSKRIPSMIGHYRNAAEGLGAGEVAKVLYRLEPASLFFTVQAFLAYLNPGSVVADGVYGAKTAAAVGAFCTEKGLFCDGTIVTFDFLEALIAAVAAREEVAGG
jgi:peptidoglycan hydrolase-like protein with peptidoglycan-binding domain